MNYHRFFDNQFDHIADIGIKKVEEKLKYPRDEIITNFIVYVSLSKLLASQNLQGTLGVQSRFLEQLKKSGLTFDHLRSVFPDLRYENHFILDKIFNSSMNASYITDKLLIDQFLKSAGVLKCGSFEEKVNVLMDVIDYKSKGYLTWDDLKQLCKQSFTMCVDAETKGLKSTDDR